MGKKHGKGNGKGNLRREGQKAKEALRNGATVTNPALAPTSVALAVVEKPPATVAASASVAVKTPPATTTSVPIIRAGAPAYDEYFRLVATMAISSIPCSLKGGLNGTENGIWLWSQGFIPGPAAILNFQEGMAQLIEATPDIKRIIDVPSSFMKPDQLVELVREKLPANIRHELVTLSDWANLIEEVKGHEPTPYHLTVAQYLRYENRIPTIPLCMIMPKFQFQQNPKGPWFKARFAVCLEPIEGVADEVTVWTANPDNLPDVPKNGSRISLTKLKGNGPVQKILNTVGGLPNGMEENFFRRYAPNTPRPRPHLQYQPQQRQVAATNK